MILRMFNKTIAVFLTAVFLFGLIPAAVFAQPNPSSSLGEVKGFNRSVFDSHFSKADREISPERWLAEAKLGASQALYAWELTASRMYEDPSVFEEEKNRVEKWSDEELEKRFSQWLIGRFFGGVKENALMNLTSSLGEIQKNYSWHLDGEGNIVFDDNTGDPLVIRPGDEDREFSSDLLKWRSEAEEIVKKSGASIDVVMRNLYPELLDYIPEERIESILAIISETGNSASASIKREFENIAAREERIFTSRRTSDIWSLRRKSDDEAARLFTEKLIAETEEACDQGIEELTARIEQAEAGSGDLALMGEEWLRLYREQFEKGLKAWEEAEERFFVRRIEWEQESFKLLSEGEETWLAAFSQFEEQRQKWELKAKELFKSGETLFEKISEDFQKNIADAKREFEINAQMRIGAGTTKVKALIDMYLVCASASVSMKDNIVFWMNQYGISGNMDPASPDFLQRLLKENNNDKNDKLAEIQNFYNVYTSYRDKALDARDKILADYAELIDTEVLKDILSPDASTEDFCLDEFQIALVRAKALVLYWERKTEIAKAVTAYAEEISGSRMTEAEGIRAWEDAKTAYNESLAVYEIELEKLNALGNDILEQQKNLSELSYKMMLAEEKLNKLNSDYSVLVNISAFNSKEYYLNELEKKYISLIEDYRSFRITGDDAVYRPALEYGLQWALSKQKEDAAAALDKLLNGDKKTDTLAELSLAELEEKAADSRIYETELRIRLAGINLFSDTEGDNLRSLNSDYSDADWYNSATGSYLSANEALRERLISDYKNSSKLLLEKRLEFEIEALMNFLEEDHDSDDFKYYTSEFFLSEAEMAPEILEILTKLKERISQGENIYTDNDEDNIIIDIFISGGSFFNLQPEELEMYYEENAFCTGLLDLFLNYETISSFGQKEAWDVSCNSLASFFADYGISQTGSFLPDAAVIFAAIRNKNGDIVENTAQFLKDFDDCFTTGPQWLEYERQNWKSSFIEYAAANIFYLGISPEKRVSDIISEQEELFFIKEELYNYAYSQQYIEDNEIEEISSMLLKINDNLLILDYMGQITNYLNNLHFEETRNEKEKHWRSHLEGKEFAKDNSEITIISAWRDGVLADALFNTVYNTNRLNDSFALFSQRSNVEAMGNSAGNQNLYLNETSWLSRQFYSLEYQYNDIAYLGRAYDFAQSNKNQVNDQIKEFIDDLKEQEKTFNALREQYYNEAEKFSESGFLYDEQYGILKTAHSNTDQYRFEYEKQDAIRRWAGTAYLDKETIDLEDCKAKLKKAKTVMEVLSDIYNDNNRSSSDPEYNKLYSEYEASFGRKIKILEISDSFTLSTLDEQGKYELILANYKASLNNLGYVDKKYENYNLPADLKDWTVKDIITVKNGKLAFNKNDSMKLSGADTSTANSLNKFFQENDSDLSAYEKSLLALSERMSGYFANNNIYKLLQWSMARDYLIYTLMSENKNIKYLESKYSGIGALSEDGGIGRQIIKPGIGIFDFEKSLYRLLTDDEWANPFSALFYTPNPKLGDYKETIRTVWEALSADEKADLEYYTILTLTNNDYNAGFSQMFTSRLYEAAYNYVNNRNEEAKKERNNPFNFLLFIPLDYMIDTNNHALSQIESIKNQTNSIAEKWISGIEQNLLNIKNLTSVYDEAYKKMAALQVQKSSEQSIAWDDILKAFGYANNLKKEDIDEIKIYWEEMQKTSAGNFTNISDAFNGLFRWAKDMENNSRRDIETYWQKSAQERLDNEEKYQAAVEKYFEESGTLDDLKTAAENAYGKTAVMWTNHIDNMHTALMKDLLLYTNMDKNFFGEFSVLGDEITMLTERALTNRYSMEYAAREIEWNYMLRDIQEKYYEWRNSANLILENGRVDWNAGYQKMQESYMQWAKNFEDEYNRVNNEWTMAYLAGIDDKERWLEQAAAAANHASDEAALLLMGAEGERLSRIVDTREPFSIRDAIPQAENLMTELLQSSGIVNMANALSSMNNISNTASTIVRRGLGGISAWNAALVKTEAAALAKKTNEEIAAAEAKKLAYTAQANANQIINSLSENVRAANQNFRESMDNTFIVNGLWRRSGNDYVKDIMIGSTLFDPVITKTEKVDGYVDYVMEPIQIKTKLDDNSLSALDSYTIMALIKKVEDEVKTYSEGIFGGKDDKPQPIPTLGDPEHPRTLSKGYFNVHIGYQPDRKAEIKDLDRKFIFHDEGKGQLGRLLADFIYWEIIDSKGKSEQAAPVWDKRMWDDTGSFFQAPTIRSMGQIWGSVAGGVASIALAAGTAGITAAAIPLISAGVSSIDDLVFGTLDTAFGYKSFDEAGLEFGKALLINTATSYIGAGFNGIDVAGKTVFDGFTNMAMNTVSDSTGKILIQAGMAGTQTAVTSLTTSAINGITYSKDGLGYNTEIFKAGTKNILGNALSSMASTYTTGTLQLENSGLDMGKLIGFNNLNKADLGKLNGLIGSLAGEAVNYAFGNDFTLNLFNLSMLTDGNVKSGLLELHLGKDGAKMNFGTGGANLSIDNLTAAFRGAQVWNANSQIGRYVTENVFDSAIALRSQYGYGNNVQKNQLRDILNGRAEIHIGEDEDFNAETTIAGGKRVINMSGYQSGMSEEDQIRLAVILGHEAYRDGIVTEDNNMETRAATLAHTEMVLRMMSEGHTGFLNENLIMDIIAYSQGVDYFNNYINKTYNSNADYWKLTENGDLEYDGVASLRDAYGNLLRSHDEMDIKSNDDIEGALLWFLGMNSDNPDDVKTIQNIMKNAGLVRGKDGRWTGSGIFYNTVADILPNTTTADNMGKTITRSTIEAMLTRTTTSNGSIIGALQNGTTTSNTNINDYSTIINEYNRRISGTPLYNYGAYSGGSSAFFDSVIAPVLPELMNEFQATTKININQSRINADDEALIRDAISAITGNEQLKINTNDTELIRETVLAATGIDILNNEGITRSTTTYCNLFARHIITTYFGEYFSNIFPSRNQRANDMFTGFLSNENMERLDVDDWGLDGIQRLANEGELIIMSYYNDNGPGHIGFVANSNLTLNTLPEINALQETSGTRLPSDQLVIFHAGTYTGITSITYATNGWNAEGIREHNLRNNLYFYRVRI